MRGRQVSLHDYWGNLLVVLNFEISVVKNDDVWTWTLKLFAKGGSVPRMVQRVSRFRPVLENPIELPQVLQQAKQVVSLEAARREGLKEDRPRPEVYHGLVQ